MFSWLGFGGSTSSSGASGGTAAAPSEAAAAPTASAVAPSKGCLRRIRNDLRALERDCGGTLFACVTDEADMTAVDACIVGLEGTPYDGGFFHFKVVFPPAYPCDCPKVELVTTGQGSVGFNPNLYANGKVCLSILGTWAGPSWSPTQSLSSVLLSIQSLMHDRPYTNEPGRENAAEPLCAVYNDFVRYAALHYALNRNLDPAASEYKAMPAPMRRFVAKAFLRRYDHVVGLVDAAIEAGKDGLAHRDPTGRSSCSGTAAYRKLLGDLEARRATVEAEAEADDDDDDDEGA